METYKMLSISFVVIGCAFGVAVGAGYPGVTFVDFGPPSPPSSGGYYPPPVAPSSNYGVPPPPPNPPAGYGLPAPVPPSPPAGYGIPAPVPPSPPAGYGLPAPVPPSPPAGYILPPPVPRNPPSVPVVPQPRAIPGNGQQLSSETSSSDSIKSTGGSFMLHPMLHNFPYNFDNQPVDFDVPKPADYGMPPRRKYLGGSGGRRKSMPSYK